MPVNEHLVKAFEPVGARLRSREDMDRARRFEQTVDRGGNLIQRAQSFVRLQSPDGSVWRVRVDNAGALSTTKES